MENGLKNIKKFKIIDTCHLLLTLGPRMKVLQIWWKLAITKVCRIKWHQQQHLLNLYASCSLLVNLGPNMNKLLSIISKFWGCHFIQHHLFTVPNFISIWVNFTCETYVQKKKTMDKQYQWNFSFILFVAHAQLLRIVNFLAKCENFRNFLGAILLIHVTITRFLIQCWTL